MIKLSKLSRNIALAMLTGGVIGVSSLAYALSNDEGDIIRNGQVATKPMNVAGLYVPPSVMLVLGREHNLFAEAYDDASDIDGDGYLDTMYDPSITYEGIFDPTICYTYNNNRDNLSLKSSDIEKNIMNGYWIPMERATNKTKTFASLWHEGTPRGTERTVPVCNESGKTKYWLGNFLNYVTTSRIDAIRKILYGGARVVNTHRTGSDSVPVHYKGKDKEGNAYEASILKHSRVLRDGHAWGKVLGNAMFREGTTQVFKVEDFTGLSSGSHTYGGFFFGLASYDSRALNDPNFNGDNSFAQARYMRVVYGSNVGQPGVVRTDEPAMNIWDWVSRETNGDATGAVGTQANVKDSSKKWESLPGNNYGGLSSSLAYGSATNMAEASIAVVVCTPDFYSETDCKNYSSDRSKPQWQPVGLLQQYGEGSKPRIKFGLITGSWQNNLGGGTLRANLGDFASEVYTSNPPENLGFKLGDFKYNSVPCKEGINCGFIKTMDNMSISGKHKADWNGGNYENCSRSMGGSNSSVRRIAGIENGKCNDWGNPVSKLLYTAALYFKGPKDGKINQVADEMKLEWKDNNVVKQSTKTVRIGYVEQKDPYDLVDYCSKPVTLLIADENISFDYANAFGGTQPFGGDTETIKGELDNVVSAKGFEAGEYIVGGNAEKESTDKYYYIPSLKYISKLSQIEGIAPSAAYAHGSYNVAGVASYFSTHELRTVHSKENPDFSAKPKMLTYVVAMKPNLPEINIDVDGQLVTILPFAKTMGDVNAKCKMNSVDSNQSVVRQCQSTNQIADFYVQNITPTSGVFRINYEDYQYGSDYDMDWVVEYDYEVIRGSKGTYVRVVTRHLEGDKFAPQHAGYLITGVDHAGVYVDLGKTTAHNPTGDASKNEVGIPQGNLDEAKEIYNFYDLDTIISDYNIINCRDLKYSSTSDLNGLVKCRFKGTYNSKADYKLNGEQLNSNNIDDYYEYITKQDFKVGNETINLYYANRLDIAKVMNSLPEKQTYAECSTGDSANDKSGITSRCFKPETDADNKAYMCGGNNRYKHLFGTPCRRDHGKAASRVFKVASTSKNYWLKSPLWYAARFGLGEVKDTVHPNDASESNIANYYEVTNMTKLRDGIAKMLDQIKKNVHSSSGFSPVTNETKTGTLIYPSVYDPSVWFGDVYQATVSSTGGYNLSGIHDTQRAKASSGFNAVKPDNRFVFTYDAAAANKDKRVVRFYSVDDKGKADGNIDKGAFSYLTCNIIKQILQEGGECSESAGSNTTSTATYDGLYYSLDDEYSKPFMNRFVRWVLGDDSYEGLNVSENASRRLPLNGGGRGFEGTPLRERKVDGEHFVLADIINSTPTYFTDNNKGYLAVGANDGMLHFIDASTMKPVLSYIPSAAWSHMKQLTSQTYDHYSFVDSTPQVYKRSNKTYVYGSFGLGLRGAYLLDVTGISTFASISDDTEKLKFAGNMLQWELTDKFKISDGIYSGSDYVGKYQEAPTLINAGGNKDNAENIPYLIFTSGINSEASFVSGKTPGVFIVNMLGEVSEDEYCYASSDSGEFNDKLDDDDEVESANVAKDLKIPCVVASAALTDDQEFHEIGINAFSDPWNLGRTPDYTNVRLATVTGNDANALGFYFADSFGNLWRHALGNDNYVNKPYNWFKEYDDSSKTVRLPRVMFVAKDSGGRNQPITVTPETGYYGGDGIAIAVGTGSYIYTYDSDVVSKVYNSSQSVYLLRDMGSVSAASGSFKGRCSASNKEDKHCLKPLNVSSTEKDDEYYRSATVSTEYNKTENYGWYMDLIPYGADGQISNSGERIITNMLIIDNMLTITPNIPAVGDNCRGSGTSSLQQINYMTGKLTTEKEIKALVTHLSATIHYDEKGIPSVVIHATVDNVEKTEGSEAIHSIELNQDVSPTRSSSWIRLF